MCVCVEGGVGKPGGKMEGKANKVLRDNIDVLTKDCAKVRNCSADSSHQLGAK